MIWLSVTALAIPPAPKLSVEAETWEFSATELCWPSGLQLHVVRRPGSGVAALTLVVEGGHAVETPETRGAAHLVEHLWFRARPGGEPSLYEREAGLEIDASTRDDATVYTTIGPAADLEDLLRIVSTRLSDPLAGVTPADIEAEAAIVRSELSWRGEHSSRLAIRYLGSGLYPADHPYRGTLAAQEELAKLGPDALRAYVATSYQPRNATLRVEGDVPIGVDAWTALMQGTFAEELIYGDGSSTCSHPLGKAPPPDPPEPVALRVTAPVRTPEVWVGWTMPAANGPDEGVLREALAFVELELWTTRAWTLRSSKDLTGGTGCEFTPGRLASSALCHVVLPTGGDPAAYVQTLRSLLSNAWAKGFEHTQERMLGLQELKSAALSEALASQDRIEPDALAERALYSHFAGKADGLAARWTAVFDSSEQDVVATASRWLTADRMVAVGLLPGQVEVDAGLPLEGKARLEAPALPGWASPLPDWTRVVRRDLPNGVEAWVVPTGDVPITYASLTFPGGSTRAPDPGTDELLRDLAVYDTPVPLRDFRYDIGASALESAGTTAATNVVVGGSHALKGELWILRAMQEGRVLDFESRQVVLDRRVQFNAPDFARDPWSTSRSFRVGHLLAGDPAGLPWWEVVRAARAVPEGRVQRWQDAVFHPDAATLLLVGSVAPAPAIEEATALVGRWKQKGDPLGAAPAAPPPPARKVFVHPTDTVQTEVALACRLPGRTAERDAALDVLEGVMYRGLWQSLREDARSYAPQVRIEPVHPELALLHLSAVVDHAQAPGATAAMLDLVRLVAAGPPDPVVAWEKQAAHGRWSRQWTSTAATWEGLVGAVEQGIGVEAVKTWPTRLEAVDGPALAALLADCAGHEAVSVIGPDATEGLAGHGLTAEKVDWVAFGTELARSLE